MLQYKQIFLKSCDGKFLSFIVSLGNQTNFDNLLLAVGALTFLLVYTKTPSVVRPQLSVFDLNHAAGLWRVKSFHQ